jgi:hypothetical protein
LIELTNLLHQRSVESETEKAKLRQQIDKMAAEIKITDEISFPWNMGTQVKKAGPRGDTEDRDYSSINPIENKRNQPVFSSDQIDDMLIRLKTTNANSDKFADTVDIIYEMLASEKQTWIKFDLDDKPKPVRNKLILPENCKFFIKAFAAKNPRVLASVVKITGELGSFSKYDDLLEQLDSATTLWKQYKTTENWVVKKLLLSVIADISNSRKFSQKFQKLGGTALVAANFVKTTRGENLTHENL